MKGALLATMLILIPVTIAGPVEAQAIETCTSAGITYDCVTESVSIRELNPAYDNGYNGTVNASEYLGPLSSFPATVANVTLRQGVSVGPSLESPARVFTSLNVTAAPNGTNTPYYTGGLETGDTGKTLKVITFSFELAPTVVMNGVSSFVYRSPLVWDGNYTSHYLQITDPDGRLAVARGHNVQGDELNDSEIVGDRVYYQIDAMVESGKTYTVREWVKTVGDKSLDHLDVYLAPGQDVDDNGVRELRVFEGLNAERIVNEDAAFAFRFVLGMGPGGTMNVIAARNDTDYVTLTALNVPLMNLTAGSDELEIIIPIRTTVPITGSALVGLELFTFTSATSTIILKGDLNPLPPEAAVFVVLNFTFDPTAECPAGAQEGCAYLSYPMLPPASGAAHFLQVGGDGTTITGFEWAPWIELIARDMVAPVDADESAKESWLLVAKGALLAGIIILPTLILAATGVIPLAVAGTVFVTLAVYNGLVLLTAEDSRAIAAALQAGATILALSACAGSLITRGLTRLALGASCALLGVAAAGGLPALLNFVLEIPEIIKAAVEKVGQFVAFMMEWGWLILVIIGIFLAPYVFFVMIKYPLLMVLGPVAGLLGYQRASQWPLFDRVYNYYMFGWTELVENRLMKMGVKR